MLDATEYVDLNAYLFRPDEPFLCSGIEQLIAVWDEPYMLPQMAIQSALRGVASSPLLARLRILRKHRNELVRLTPCMIRTLQHLWMSIA